MAYTTTSYGSGDGSSTNHTLIGCDLLTPSMDAHMMLENNGYQVLGAAGSVEGALRLLDELRSDAAVLDGNLRGRPVIPVDWRLRSLKIPFVLSSAYDKAPDMRRAGRHHDTLLGKMRAQRIARLRALAHQKVSGPVSHRRSLLRFALHGHEPHGRTRGGLGDRFGIGHVVLLPLHKWLHIDR